MVPKVLSRPTQVVIALGLCLPLLLIGFPALLARRAAEDVKTSFAWVTHTLEVQRAVQGLLNSLIDAETGQRGYLLTHRANYLEPYESGNARVAEQLQEIRALTADNPYQVDRLREVRPLIDDRMAILAQTITLERQNDHDGAMDIVISDKGKSAMDKIRGILVLMQNEETRLLSMRQQQFTERINHSGRTLLLMVGASACAVAGILYLIYRLSRLQPLVRMCAWSRTIEFHGQWISFEEYLQRRFNISTNHGISPSEMEKLRQVTESGAA
jgi:CHASE3 domain sensor protein